MKLTSITLAMAASLIAIDHGLADTIKDPEPDPVVLAPTIPSWSGLYGGVRLGYGNVDGEKAAPCKPTPAPKPTAAAVPLVGGTTPTKACRESHDGDGFVGGLTGGYDHDMGKWVVGAAIDYDWLDIDANGTDVESVWRAKVRSGFKAGRGLLYATGGYAKVDTDTAGDSGGYVVGGGYEHLINDQFSVGTELLYHKFDDFNDTTLNMDVTTIHVQGIFRF